MIECDFKSPQLIKAISDIEAVNMTNIGVFIAFTIVGLWSASLVLLLLLDTSKFQIPLIVSAILWQTFLYTGLFITAHDAIHGVVFAKNPKINNWIGRIAVIIDALFSYKNSVKKHWLNHQQPGTEADPDFDNNQYQNVFAWYFRFMKSYLDLRQLFGLALIFNILNIAFKIPEINLNLFWIIPSILSSIQLFHFGTFIPHKRMEGVYTNLLRIYIVRKAFHYLLCGRL